LVVGWRGTEYDSDGVIIDLILIGVIIDYCTQKVLFIGIRNKFYTVCDIVEPKNVEEEFINVTKILITMQALQEWEAMLSLRVSKVALKYMGHMILKQLLPIVIAVYQSIIDNRPYQEWMIEVKKIECSTHLHSFP